MFHTAATHNVHRARSNMFHTVARDDVRRRSSNISRTAACVTHQPARTFVALAAMELFLSRSLSGYVTLEETSNSRKEGQLH